MPCLEIAQAWAGSSTMYVGTGYDRSGDVVNARVWIGKDLTASQSGLFRKSAYCIHGLFTASAPKPEGGARCVSSARRDLRRGRGVILVPTATSRSTHAGFLIDAIVTEFLTAGAADRRSRL